uniref:Uncharacterized protein n=1 Tax=Anguilla anguilla TaxID=7936 RepID=A0A0E9S7J1_ANGAN
MSQPSSTALCAKRFPTEQFCKTNESRVPPGQRATTLRRGQAASDINWTLME